MEVVVLDLFRCGLLGADDACSAGAAADEEVRSMSMVVMWDGECFRWGKSSRSQLLELSYSACECSVMKSFEPGNRCTW